ncbi:MAG: preprotein translocase subunit SecG [Actinobacteria bacterium]|nr:preprotein translocase subunit SecG [Actinomycetota bacterium]
MSALLVITLIVWLISAAGLVVFVLLHSGKGTGLSDMIASTMYSNTTGTSIVEKNLDRITIVFGVLFIVSLLVLMLIYPQGSVSL